MTKVHSRVLVRTRWQLVILDLVPRRETPQDSLSARPSPIHVAKPPSDVINDRMSPCPDSSA
jgi:hypothetical protein